IAAVLWTETGEAGVVEFVRRLVFNMLIGNADMHLKNWSLIYPNRRTTAIAPAYDFVSTITYLPEDKLALKFVDSKEFSSVNRDQFQRFTTKARLPMKATLDTMHETVARFGDVWLNPGAVVIPERVRHAIDRHLPTVPLWAEERSKS
ncbi:MAG: HipA domain-containing protein, partial [Steroidobacteraceae bacterium]